MACLQTVRCYQYALRHVLFSRCSIIQGVDAVQTIFRIKNKSIKNKELQRDFQVCASQTLFHSTKYITAVHLNAGRDETRLNYIYTSVKSISMHLSIIHIYRKIPWRCRWSASRPDKTNFELHRFLNIKAPVSGSIQMMTIHLLTVPQWFIPAASHSHLDHCHS